MSKDAIYFALQDTDEKERSILKLMVYGYSNSEISKELNIIKPTLEIDTNEVSASHFVTIGPLDEKLILYLESMGINKENAKKLLKKSFIYNIFNDDFISLLNDKEGNNE